MRPVIAVFASVLLGSCTSPPSILEQIVASGELRVVTRNSPVALYHGTDEPRGIEYELALGFAERLGVRLRISAADRLGQLLPDVAAGNAHVAAAGLTIGDTGGTVMVGPGYQQVEQQLIYRRGRARPKSLAGVGSGAVYVVAGSGAAALLREQQSKHAQLTIIESAASTEILTRRVAEGQIAYAIVDSNEFELLRHYYPEARVAFDLGQPSQLRWAIPPGAHALREQVSAYFAELEATGKLGAILERYYFGARDFDYVGSRAFVRHLKSRLPRYRDMFEFAERETGIDWRLLAAIAYQESHWDPQAVSPTGVRGLMMLTQRTAGMMGVADRDDPLESIVGGARYFHRVLGKIPERIPADDRRWLAVAAYNLGFGHVEDARIITEIQGGDIDSWDAVRERLPLLSDERWHKQVRRGYARGAVAAQYAENVRRYYALLLWMVDTELLTDGAADAQPDPASS